jgi:hypothetical protein
MKLTVIVWNKDRAYFFKKDSYIRYRIADAGSYAEAGYPRPIANPDNWKFPAFFNTDIDAAVAWPNGKAYFFKGDKYIRYDMATDKSDYEDPVAIAGHWHDLPDSFNSGIDAAMLWPDNNNAKAYFFKGDQYVQVDTKTKTMDPTYPRPIKGTWHNLPDSFNSGIDAAVAWRNGKAYFFKGDNYARIDMKTKTMDAGFHLSIRRHWYGLLGGPFGQPDVTINYSQTANFNSFVDDNHQVGAGGMFMIYKIKTIVNNQAATGTNSVPNWEFDLSRVFVSDTSERSGNFHLDPYLKSAPDNLSVSPGSHSLSSKGTLVVDVAGDPKSLKTAFRPLHYHLDGVSVLAVRTPGDHDPVFVYELTSESAGKFK